ncbi:MAG: hypothetical protein VXW58_10295, partial [Pseudomonadota bacterium]|nr:hypothetical protein [Pseudomonadota bacterium]
EYDVISATTDFFRDPSVAVRDDGSFAITYTISRDDYDVSTVLFEARNFGTNDGERIRDGKGADWISGRGGDDVIFGLRGEDMLFGNGGADRLVGQAQADRLFGGGGSDILKGGLGSDVLKGGNLRDILDGQKGRDKLFGGDGKDVFVFRADDGHDRIKDFEAGLDKLRFWGLEQDDLTFSDTSAGLRISYDGGSVLIVDTSEADLSANAIMYL